jgi:NAD(P)H-hydrate repair Nnr-like enzyme with NAD(P)H-hydrate dehydratase domain
MDIPSQLLLPVYIYTRECATSSNDISDEILPLLAGFGGSVVTGVAARQAVKEKGKAMMATDLNSKVGEAYQ